MPHHYGHFEKRIVTQSSSTGTQFMQAVGTAMGRERVNAGEVVYVSSGEGTTSQGDFYEAIKKRTAVIDDAIAIRSMVYLSLTYDHRLIDGLYGSSFLESVVEFLESAEERYSNTL
jgi:hypothetical protein